MKRTVTLKTGRVSLRQSVDYQGRRTMLIRVEGKGQMDNSLELSLLGDEAELLLCLLEEMRNEKMEVS